MGYLANADFMREGIMYDVLIKGGFVVDGSGAPGATMDIAIEGDRIVALGRIDGSARRVDRKSTRLNSSHPRLSRMPSSA